METISFSLLINKIKHVFISSYNPHYRLKSIYLSYLRSFLESLKLTNKIILFGDLNQDLHSPNGDDLRSLMAYFNFTEHGNQPTRIAKTSSTLIDVVFSNSPDLVKVTQSIDCPFSDHNFVVFAIEQKRLAKGATLLESRFLTPDKLDKIDNELKLLPFNVLEVIDNVSDRFHFFN